MSEANVGPESRNVEGTRRTWLNADPDTACGMTAARDTMSPGSSFLLPPFVLSYRIALVASLSVHSALYSRFSASSFGASWYTMYGASGLRVA